MANESLPYYIDRLAEGSITTSEWQTLQELLRQDGQNEILVDILDQQLIQLANDPIEYPDVIERVQSAVIHHIAIERQVPSVHRVHFLKTTWFRHVAAILLLFGIGTYFYTKQPAPIKNDISPGGNQAVLTLSDGSTILLDSATNGKIAVQAGSSILKKDGQVVYDPRGQNTSTVIYNTMTTPKGGQYQLTLADGTKVWLNAASSITYPTAFAGNNREVKITGEAYFEVTKDSRRPFLVNINNASAIEVLGTHFNVSAYPDEISVKTTLVEGRVKVTSEKASLTLNPGQQSITTADHIDLEEHADLESVLAWKNGLFHMQGISIPAIMRELSRWYDIDIVYTSSVSQTLITGEIPRNMKLSSVLRILEENDVHTKIEGRKLTVLP
jgi:transmembrane sensor